MTERWAVVGGGFIGLRLAEGLAERGADVTLLDGAADFGGLAAPWQLGPLRWDRHYHVILGSDRRVRALAERLGLAADLRWVTTGASLFDGQTLHPVSGVADYLKLPILGPIAKARLAMTIGVGLAIRRPGRLQDQSLETWLRRWSGNRTYQTFWRPLLAAKLGPDFDDVSATFIWSTIQRLLTARTEGRGTDQFGYVTGGGHRRLVNRLVQRLSELGVNLMPGHAVTEARSTRAGLTLRAGNTASSFDFVVVTTAAPLAGHICPELETAEAAKLNTVAYRGVLCLSLLLKGPLSRSYLTYLTDPAAPFTAVIEGTAFVDPAELDGHHLIYLPRYAKPDDAIFEESDETLTAKFVAYLRLIYPDLGPEDIVASRISRSRYVFPVPLVGGSPPNEPGAPTSVPGLFLVSSASLGEGTSTVEQSLALAEAALSRWERDGYCRTADANPTDKAVL